MFVEVCLRAYDGHSWGGWADGDRLQGKKRVCFYILFLGLRRGMGARLLGGYTGKTWADGLAGSVSLKNGHCIRIYAWNTLQVFWARHGNQGNTPPIRGRPILGFSAMIRTLHVVETTVGARSVGLEGFRIGLNIAFARDVCGALIRYDRNGGMGPGAACLISVWRCAKWICFGRHWIYNSPCGTLHGVGTISSDNRGQEKVESSPGRKFNGRRTLLERG